MKINELTTMARTSMRALAMHNRTSSFPSSATLKKRADLREGVLEILPDGFGFCGH